MSKISLKSIEPEMRERIKKALNKTWNYIGDDFLSEFGDISQEEVIEVVLDADRVKTHGGDVIAAEVLYELSYSDMKKIAKVVFPFKRYGM